MYLNNTFSNTYIKYKTTGTFFVKLICLFVVILSFKKNVQLTSSEEQKDLKEELLLLKLKPKGLTIFQMTQLSSF